jgi:hypothetical protein
MSAVSHHKHRWPNVVKRQRDNSLIPTFGAGHARRNAPADLQIGLKSALIGDQCDLHRIQTASAIGTCLVWDIVDCIIIMILQKSRNVLSSSAAFGCLRFPHSQGQHPARQPIVKNTPALKVWSPLPSCRQQAARCYVNISLCI